MSCSKVYFTDFRSYHEEALTHKLQRLMDKAGLGQLDMEGKYVAIKMHFGELGNLAFLRPNWAKAVADYVKSKGGRPFLTDCNTLYVGSRKNALDHLDTAFENGFNLFSTGCQILIADGLKGTDDVLVPVDGDYIKQAKIGRAVMDADVIISLTHFKGHESTGFGGAIKNLGMGCGSRAGKMEMHSSPIPYTEPSVSQSCALCTIVPSGVDWWFPSVMTRKAVYFTLAKQLLYCADKRTKSRLESSYFVSLPLNTPMLRIAPLPIISPTPG